MRIADAKSTFETLVASNEEVAEGLGPASAIAYLTEFFATTPAEDAEFEGLYLNWGTYDSEGGQSFQYSIWRQFYGGGDPEDADGNIWELEYRFHFDLNDETAQLGDGGEMCIDPSDAADFKRRLEALLVTDYVVRSTPLRSTFSFQAGG